MQEIFPEESVSIYLKISSSVRGLAFTYAFTLSKILSVNWFDKEVPETAKLAEEGRRLLPLVVLRVRRLRLPVVAVAYRKLPKYRPVSNFSENARKSTVPEFPATLFQSPYKSYALNRLGTRAFTAEVKLAKFSVLLVMVDWELKFVFILRK